MRKSNWAILISGTGLLTGCLLQTLTAGPDENEAGSAGVGQGGQSSQGGTSKGGTSATGGSQQSLGGTSTSAGAANTGGAGGDSNAAGATSIGGGTTVGGTFAAGGAVGSGGSPWEVAHRLVEPSTREDCLRPAELWQRAEPS